MLQPFPGHISSITSAVLGHLVRTHVPLIFLYRDKKSYRLSEKCANTAILLTYLLVSNFTARSQVTIPYEFEYHIIQVLNLLWSSMMLEMPWSIRLLLSVPQLPLTPAPIREYNGFRGENRGPFKSQRASPSNPVMSRFQWPWVKIESFTQRARDVIFNVIITSKWRCFNISIIIIGLCHSPWKLMGISQTKPEFGLIFLILTLYMLNFSVNINIYLHFMSFLHTNKTQVIEIPPRVRQGPAYST